MRMKDLTGQKFDRLTALRFDHKDTHSNTYWVFVCDCGKEHVARGSEVSRGAVKSCGCLVIDKTKIANTLHGDARSTLYKTWISMRSRCMNENDHMFPDYGARGITVCPEWADDYEEFKKDMGIPPKGMSLDRIDNNKGYSKDNCRWASHSDQMRNKRTSKFWFVDGVKFETLKEAAEHFGVATRTIYCWCEGYMKRGKYLPPKPNCWSAKKYEEAQP